MNYIVAIDGPSGAGKTTTAELLANRLGGEALDTGAMYRAAALAAAKAVADVTDIDKIAEFVCGLDLNSIQEAAICGDIRSSEIAEAASTVSAIPAVRDHLRYLQRLWAQQRGGGVIEGRDICEHVFPQAKHKFYLTASSEARAVRRAAETGESMHQVLADIETRDEADRQRAYFPFRKAEDAIEIDNTYISAEQTVETIERIIAESS